MYYNMTSVTGNIYAISDLEGFSIETMFPNYKLKPQDKLIICGDVMDSTAPGQITKEIQITKSKNIENILNIVSDNRISLTFGNRDLNKLKVGPLTDLTGNDILIESFNKCMLTNLSVDTYNKFANLRKPLGWTNKLSNWYPFWGATLKDKLLYWKDDNEPANELDTNKNVVRKYGFFEKRFLKIFGADTSVGTMGAGNLLETIPIELGINLHLQTLDSTNIDIQDYKAFVVLAVFRAMLKQIKFTKTTQLKNFLQNNNQAELSQSLFLGLLYTMFTQDKNNMIIVQNKCTTDTTCTYSDTKFLFSHGGVSRDIVSTDNLLGKMRDEINNATELTTILTNVQKIQIAGYYRNDDTNTNVPNIDENITKFNNTIKTSIKKVFDEITQTSMKIPSTDMLLILIATAPFDCSSFYNKINKQLNCSGPVLNTSSSFTSTMAGIIRLREPTRNSLFVHCKQLYNIFGHIPNGFGTTIDLFENTKEDKKTYIINLDTSNTFSSTPLNNASNSYTYIKIPANTSSKNPVQITTNIDMAIDGTKAIALLSNIKTDELFKDVDNKIDIVLAHTGTKPSKITIINNIDETMDNNIRRFKDSDKIFYHGIDSNNNVIFTYNYKLGHPFPKCLFVIDNAMFDKIFPPASEPLNGGSKCTKYIHKLTNISPADTKFELYLTKLNYWYKQENKSF